ncbi:WD40/YVTN/BNR-like repeat-containing protein [Roseateles koreensis]|uniref:YCF48-related protein n=1 Tax=Roseateles koreensis TaxID=2987526 RepID=A0ABT5KP00_9BURK|nr:YCF48-related protein [Roseateles koreensis]MDC8784653.1 YCF48-related protein [Roseateles koreensis]
MRWTVKRHAVCLLAVLSAMTFGAAAQTSAGRIGSAWERPALQLRDPAHAVYLAAADAGGRLVAVGERGVIATRERGEGAWHQQPSPTSVTLTAVQFVDARDGVAVGHAGTVLTTLDGGQTWQLKLDGRRLSQIALDDAKAAGDPARIRDAERLVADGPDKPLLDVLAWDARHMLVVGAYGLAFHTADGGRTWQSWMGRLPNPRGLHLYAARRQGNHLLLAGEQGLLLQSEDEGLTFKAVSAPYKGSWFTAEMRSATEWLVAGLRGNVWRTADAGATWQQLSNPIPAAVTASKRLPDGAVLLANQAGFVLRVGAQSLQPLNPQPLPPLAGLATDGDQRLWALGMAGPVLIPAIRH